MLYPRCSRDKRTQGIINDVPNRLAAEHSPYLLQHKDNPVDWYPWGEDAFARARNEDKPIFLSIGKASAPNYTNNTNEEESRNVSCLPSRLCGKTSLPANGQCGLR